MKSKDFVLCALFTSLIICGTYIRIPVPFIPFTLQSAFVTLSGLLLGCKKSAASTVTYLLLGLVGFPVFTGGGGLSYVFNPTFGYIIGFILGASLTGLIAQKFSPKNFRTNLLAGFVGLAVIYVCGIVYYCLINSIHLHTELSFRHIFIYCFLTTAPGDILLTVVAAYTARRLAASVKN